MGTQLSPNVSARKDARVLVPMTVPCPEGTASLAILMFIMFSKFQLLDCFFTFTPGVGKYPFPSNGSVHAE
jgi:hypothetical protein